MNSIPTDPRFQSDPPADARFQSEPPAPRTPALTDSEGLPDFRLPASGPWPTRRQWVQLAIFPGVFAVVFLGMLIFNLNYVRLLWEHHLGVKMSLAAAAASLLGMAIQFGSVLLLNVRSSPDNPNHPTPPRILAALGGVAVILLYASALFVLWSGPAAIRIIEAVRAIG